MTNSRNGGGITRLRVALECLRTISQDMTVSIAISLLQVAAFEGRSLREYSDLLSSRNPPCPGTSSVMSIYPDKKDGVVTGRWRVEVQLGSLRKRGRFDTMAEAKAAEKPHGR
jgi:hypothetical protein